MLQISSISLPSAAPELELKDLNAPLPNLINQPTIICLNAHVSSLQTSPQGKSVTYIVY